MAIVPKVTSLQYLCNISRKKWKMKLIFWLQINIKGFFKLLDKLQKWICRTVGPSLATSLEPLILCQNVAMLSLFCRYYFGRYSSELAQLVLLPYSEGRSSCYSDSLHDISVTIPRCWKDVYVNSSFPCTARAWNSLPMEFFPLTYLNGLNMIEMAYDIVWSK